MKHRIHLITSLVFLLTFRELKAQYQPFIQEEVIKTAGITSDSQIYSLGKEQKQTTRYYFDGLGRTVQTVAIGASPQQRDIIAINRYDDLGRQVKSYLPYTVDNDSGKYRADALVRQAAFYSNGAADKIADDPAPYSQQVFENSPLQRLLQAGSVGESFQPGQHYKAISYRQNTAADDVWRWSTEGTRNGSYPAATLYVTQGTDEQGNQSLTFTDNQGKTVLKRQLASETINGTAETYFDTYYVYNRGGQTLMIIPPKAVSLMRSTGSWDPEQPAVSRLLFRLIYDERGRLIEKKVPEGSSLYIVYDPLERPVLLQDGKLRAGNQWNYIKYDVKGRAISQGIYTDAVRTSRAAMQAYVSGLDYSTRWYEDRSSASAIGYYTSLVFPSANTEPLAYSYYDDYDLDKNGAPDYSYQAQGLTGEATATPLTRGMLTVVRKRTVGTGLGNVWLMNVQFYDKRGNVIQVRSNNQLNSGLNDSKTMVPDFRGKAVAVKTVKASASGSTAVLSSYSYDHSERLKAIDDSYNGAAAIRIASYEYNELGQVVDKKLHSANGGGSYLQSVDFRYNIRGQLISINNSTLTADTRNDETSDVFGMEMLYEQPDNSIGNTAYYNGSLSAVKWKSKDPQNTSPKERSYRFEYDKLYRLKNALYSEKASGGSWGNAGAFDEKNIRYDQNGNILSLERNAYIGSAITVMDNLTYSYEGNRLANLSEAGSSSLGYKNLTGSAVTYSYDESGNQTGDPKKGITQSYNILGRTEKVTVTTSAGRYINYTYDASGVLIRKQQYDNNTLAKTTDYIEGFVYENGTLSYFAMAEGRVRNTGSSLKPEYMLSDYQGNVRVSFEEQNGQAVVRQENSYYPFGLIMPGGTLPTQPNKKLYNGGSEWQNDYGDLPDYYQTFYRNYDAAIGRFLSVDPVAEASDEISTYHYAGNNPLIYNDPLGDMRKRPSYGMEPLIYMDNYGGLEDDGMNATGTHQEVPLFEMINAMLRTFSGGSWSPSMGSSFAEFGSDYQALSATFVWNQFAGDRISQEEWQARGGDSRVLSRVTNPQFYTGGWVNIAGNYSGSSYNNSTANSGGRFDATGTFVGSIGLAGDLASTSRSTFRLTNGAYNGSAFSPKLYSGWKGGSVARITTYSVSKVGSSVSFGAGVVGTGMAYNQIFNGTPNATTYVDAGVGTVGIMSSLGSYYAGVEVPYVGEAVAVYGTSRLIWDVFFDLGQNYGPSTWYGTNDNKWFK